MEGADAGNCGKGKFWTHWFAVWLGTYCGQCGPVIHPADESGFGRRGCAVRSIPTRDEEEWAECSKATAMNFIGKEIVMAKNTKLNAEVSEAPVVGDLAEEQQAQIRQRAYDLYVARGQEDGHDLEDWVRAEAEISADRAPRN